MAVIAADVVGWLEDNMPCAFGHFKMFIQKIDKKRRESIIQKGENH